MSLKDLLYGFYFGSEDRKVFITYTLIFFITAINVRLLKKRKLFFVIFFPYRENLRQLGGKHRAIAEKLKQAMGVHAKAADDEPQTVMLSRTCGNL